MAMRFEQWLDRRVEVKPDEVGLSEAARQRLYRPEEGAAAIPAGIIRPHPSGALGEYAVRDHDGEFSAAIGMTEGEVDRKMAVVDARILGGPGHRYDSVFNELRDERVNARYERIHRKATRYKALAGLAGAAALAAIWTAAYLPLPRLVGEDNCYNGTSAQDTFIKAASSVRPAIRQHAAQHGDTCELGGRQYVLLRKDGDKGKDKNPKQHKRTPDQKRHQAHHHQAR